MIRRNVVLAVCERGHVLGELDEAPKDPLGYCSICGAVVVWFCAQCKAPIVGLAEGFGSFSSFPTRYQTHGDFCSNCGMPFPWASRQAIAHHIENTLSRQPGLGSADRRALVERLKILQREPATREIEQKQVGALSLFKKAAPKAWEIAVPLIDGIATPYIKAKLGLPPS